jgi:AraC-like DNA-binding protein
MATRLHVSVSQLKRIFRRELGVSPRELVIRQRMKVAIDKLTNTNLTVAVIAEELGYDSLHSFTRLFTRHVGEPPGRYRTRFGHARKNPER